MNARELSHAEAESLRTTRLGREVKSTHPALPIMHRLCSYGLVEVTAFKAAPRFPMPSTTTFTLTVQGRSALAELDHEEALARMTDAARGGCPGCDEQRETGRRPPYGSHNRRCPFSE